METDPPLGRPEGRGVEHGQHPRVGCGCSRDAVACARCVRAALLAEKCCWALRLLVTQIVLRRLSKCRMLLSLVMRAELPSHASLCTFLTRTAPCGSR